MKASAEVESRGLRAYEQARAFERLRTWRLPVTLVFFPLLAEGTALGLAYRGYGAVARGDAALGLLLAWLAWRQWKHLAARHAKNLRLLRELEAEYGDGLPWLEMERHFAKLNELQNELAGEKE